jgi:serine/threonine-protein kinase
MYKKILAAAACTLSTLASTALPPQPAVAGTKVPITEITIGAAIPNKTGGVFWGGKFIVPNKDISQSVDEGQLSLYRVHIAKMFEVTNYLCKKYFDQDPVTEGILWDYRASNGKTPMGKFKIPCSRAREVAIAYGLVTPEPTNIRFIVGSRHTKIYPVPILNITGLNVKPWLSFTQGISPEPPV